MKYPFLCVYEYGTGGVWVIIHARSREEISDKYPQLTIVEQRPDFVDDEMFRRIVDLMSFDIDRPTGWLLELGLPSRRHIRKPLDGFSAVLIVHVIGGIALAGISSLFAFFGEELPWVVEQPWSLGGLCIGAAMSVAAFTLFLWRHRSRPAPWTIGQSF